MKKLLFFVWRLVGFLVLCFLPVFSVVALIKENYVQVFFTFILLIGFNFLFFDYIK